MFFLISNSMKHFEHHKTCNICKPVYEINKYYYYYFSAIKGRKIDNGVIRLPSLDESMRKPLPGRKDHKSQRPNLHNL